MDYSESMKTIKEHKISKEDIKKWTDVHRAWEKIYLASLEMKKAAKVLDDGIIKSHMMLHASDINRKFSSIQLICLKNGGPTTTKNSWNY